MECRKPGSPTWPGRLIESCLAVHSGSADRLLDAEPVPARGAVPGPVQPRMIREDLQAGPHDEQQQEEVEEVLHTDP